MGEIMVRFNAFFAVLATVLASLLPGSASADALADIKKAGVIKIAVPQDFPPFGTVGKDMKPLGYDIDVAALIAKDMGVKLELVPVSSTNRIPYLQTKKVDLVISSLGKNPDREKVIDFSNAYAPFFSGAFATPDVKVASAADLAGKSVGVTRGSLEDIELTKVAPPTADIKRFEDNNATLSAFLAGQVTVLVSGNVVAAAVAERQPARKPEAKFIIKESPCYIGLNKAEPALQKWLNDFIEAKIKSGELNAVSMKWLHAPLGKI
jgi:polar amino acid transport system substrate-binding protein